MRSARTLTLVFLAALGAAAPIHAEPPPLNLDSLNKLSAAAHNVVNLTMDEAMLKAAASLLPPTPAGETTRSLLARLKSISVRSYQFDHDGAYADADVAGVRAQLTAPWTPLLSLNLREPQQHVDVFSWREGNQPQALALVVTEPRAVTVVDVLGPLDLSQLAALAGVPGLPDLGAVIGAPPAVPPPTR